MSESIKTISKDRGWNNFIKAMNELDGIRADVGIWGNEIHINSAVPVVLIAIWNMYGVDGTEANENGEGGNPTIPARDFMKQAADTGREAIYEDALRFSRQVIAGRKSGTELLASVARKYAKHMKRTIDLSPTWAVPNALSTALKKGENHPLMESFQMRDSIKSRVRNKGSVSE